MRVLAALALAALAVVPGGAQGQQGIDLAAERAGIAAFQRYDQRLQDVGWRLLAGNAAFCPRTRPAIGLQLQDAESYGAPAIARAALGLTGSFAVQTAAEGSPAALSGALPANREIARIGDDNPNQWPVERGARWQRTTQAHDRIDALLAEAGRIRLTFADGETATITPVTVCAGRYELAGRSDRMVATGERVLIGIESESFGYDLDTFAAGVAHETAHMLLDHTAWLDRNGRSNRNRRATEIEADRMIPWLLANAGYDPNAAPRFFEAFRPPSGSVLFLRGSHYRWRERAAAVAGEIAAVETLMAREGKADWRTHFRREIDPAKGLRN